jgi:hypothetical protein
VSERHPKNAPGDFYVGKNECIACGAPEREAPELMSHTREGGDYHCFFHRQPETSEEVEHAVWAVFISCCDSVYYAGKDDKLMAQLRELDRRYGCPSDSDGKTSPRFPKSRVF